MVLFYGLILCPHSESSAVTLRFERKENVANIKSQKKRIITNEKARLRNRAVKSELKTATKKVHTAIEEGKRDEAIAAAQDVGRLYDKAVSKGVVHKNQAANRKSGLMKAANAVPAK